MTANDILNRWLQYAGVEESHNLLSAQYKVQQCCRTLAKLQEYDPEGLFSVMYAKRCFLRICGEYSIKLYDILNDAGSLSEERELWAMFHSPEVTHVESTLLNSVDSLVSRVTQQKQLGERDLEKEKDVLLDSVEVVVDDIQKCQTDLYLGSDKPIGPISKFSTSIHVFERLAECLLALEQADDGIYLCYINNGGTSDGYFGFFIKSNGNLISINERQDEAYPGQHKVGRNGRWQDGKSASLFPYSFIFDFSDRDYKGYARNCMIDEEQLQFFHLSPEAYMPLIIAMLMLVACYTGLSGNSLGLKQTLTDSMLECNLREPLPGKELELVVPEHSAIVAAHEQAQFEMSAEDIKSPSFGKKFASRTPGKTYKETGAFGGTEDAELFISLYGDGFQLDTSSLLKSNPGSHLQLPGEVSPDAEFVGSKDRLEMLAYARGREQLAEYIREQMFLEFQSFGGKPAVMEWYNKALLAQKEAIMQLLGLAVTRYPHCSSKDLRIAIGGEPNHIYLTPFNQTIGDRYNQKVLCPVTGNRCSVFFVVTPRNWKQIAALIGGEDTIPKILRGWKEEGHSISGNTLLDMTDAVTGVGTPFEHIEGHLNKRYWTKSLWRDYYFRNASTYKDWTTREPEMPVQAVSPLADFTFVVGFSKIGFRKTFNTTIDLCRQILGEDE